eukprot:336560_1
MTKNPIFFLESIFFFFFFFANFFFGLGFKKNEYVVIIKLNKVFVKICGKKKTEYKKYIRNQTKNIQQEKKNKEKHRLFVYSEGGRNKKKNIGIASCRERFYISVVA